MLQKINHVAAILIHSTVTFNPHDVVIIALSLGCLKKLESPYDMLQVLSNMQKPLNLPLQ